jgi:hypothetical protein
MAVRIPADMNAKPHWVAVTDYKDIQSTVGGPFDAVSTKVDPAEFNANDDRQAFVLCGYVHDEGLLIGLPVNQRASVMFQRELVGDVLVLSGTNPTSGAYDGDNYDVPGWYADRLMDGTLEWVIDHSEEMSETIAKAIELALKDGVYSQQDIDHVLMLMEQGPDELTSIEIEAVNMVMLACVLYYKGRMSGNLPKHDVRGYELLDEGLSDEMIADFMRSLNGGE